MSPSIVDLRGLQPPEPLMRILDAVEGLASGPFVFLLDREPLPLYGMLARAWAREVRRDERGVVLTLLRR